MTLPNHLPTAHHRHAVERPAGGLAREGFTMLELQVAMIVLAVGLMGISGLMVRQSRQVSRLEQWCANDPTYYVQAQSDKWMQAIGAPANLASNASSTVWVPPVSGKASNTVTLLSCARSFDGQQMTATVTIQVIGSAKKK